MNNGRYHKIRSGYRRAKRFSSGTLEGLVAPFMIATSKRRTENSGLIDSDWAAIGFFLGSSVNVLGHAYASLRHDDARSLLVFAPMVVANIASLGYEAWRKYYKSENKD